VATLHIYLTDGFKDDRVAVSVDGRKVFDERGVTTKKLLGYAQQLSPVSVVNDTVQLQIELPEKGLSTTISADLSRGSHVPIAVENGRFIHSVLKDIGFG
jgi:hypothetical protein